MHLATYDRRSLRREGLISADIYPSKDAQRGLGVIAAHPVSDEALAHYARQPAPVMADGTGKMRCMARSFTPFERGTFE